MRRKISGFKRQISGFKIQDSRFKIQEMRRQISGFKIQDSRNEAANIRIQDCSPGIINQPLQWHCVMTKVIVSLHDIVVRLSVSTSVVGFSGSFNVVYNVVYMTLYNDIMP